MKADEEPADLPHLWIVGAGRAGLALGTLLLERGAASRLTFRGRAASAPADPIFRNASARYRPGTSAVGGALPTAVLISVPDGALAGMAAELASAGLPTAVPILHTSGALGTEVLRPLRATGHPVGTIHPLVSIPDSATGARRLSGACFGVEGDPEAVAVATLIIRAAGGHSLPLTGTARALYHAAAVFASNFTTTLLATSERLFVEAGIEPADARRAATALAAGAVENAGAVGPAQALTGPLARGDVATVRLHLERLSPPERALYSVLARHTLELAREAGLPVKVGEALAHLLEEAD